MQSTHSFKGTLRFGILLGVRNRNLSKSAFVVTKMLPVCVCTDDVRERLPEGAGDTEGLWGGRVPAWACKPFKLWAFGTVGIYILPMQG